MRIYWIDNMTTGCGHVRTMLPMQELMQRGHACTVGYPRFSLDTGDWDAIALGRLVLGEIRDALPEIKRRGLKVIYDIDDALDLLEPDNPVYPHIMANIDVYYQMLRSAALVSVTTRELAEHAHKFVPDSARIVVLPNCIREDEWRMREGGNAVPRIGFAGGNSHLRNLCVLLEAIRMLQRNGFGDRFEFVLFGISSAHDSFEEYYDANISVTARAPQTIFRESLAAVRDLLAQVSHTWERSVSVQSYPERLSALNLDLGLCPIRPTDFNRFKSCLKAYEYSMVGTEVMCARAKPYVDELPATLFPLVAHDEKSWHNVIADWIRGYSSSRTTAAARAQRDWVVGHKTIQRNIRLWETVFPELIEQ